MSEQNLRISTLQSRLDEQRQRAEELQRAGTSDLNMKLYDLQNDLRTLQETLTSREKQIVVLKNHLAQSKEIIDRQEVEIAQATSENSMSGDQRVNKLEADILNKNAENKMLKDKIRTEMINKLALPDLMETMLADKNEEIDFLKEQLEIKEREVKTLGMTKQGSAATTFTESMSQRDMDEMQCIRKAVDSKSTASVTNLFGLVSFRLYSVVQIATNLDTHFRNLSRKVDTFFNNHF